MQAKACGLHDLLRCMTPQRSHLGYDRVRVRLVLVNLMHALWSKSSHLAISYRLRCMQSPVSVNTDHAFRHYGANQAIIIAIAKGCGHQCL